MGCELDLKQEFQTEIGSVKMPKLKWEVIHECDDEVGNPTQWASEINHPQYGKYCWISDADEYFIVEVDCGGFKELAKCKSLASAKRWVSTQLMKRRFQNGGRRKDV